MWMSRPAPANAPSTTRFQLLDGRERRQRVDRAQVVVVDDERAAGSDCIPQVSEHGGRVADVEQQQPGVDEIERRAGDRRAGLEVGRHEHALVVPGGVQHPLRLARRGRRRRRRRTRSPPARRAGPSGASSRPGPQPASRQRAPAASSIRSSSCPVAASQTRACTRSRSYSSGVRPSTYSSWGACRRGGHRASVRRCGDGRGARTRIVEATTIFSAVWRRRARGVRSAWRPAARSRRRAGAPWSGSCATCAPAAAG